VYTTIVLADHDFFFLKNVLTYVASPIDLVSDLTVFSGMDM
jgi:hypothetical protein